MELEKRRNFIINFLYFVIILGISIFLCRYALSAVMPFVIALLVALLLRPIIRFLNEKCRIQKGVAGVVLVLLFYALIGFLLTILSIKFFLAAKAFFLHLPTLYNDTIEPWLFDVFKAMESFTQKLDPKVSAAYDMIAANVTTTLGETIGSLSKQVVGFATNFTLKLPKYLLNLLIMIIATIFFSIDLPLLKEFMLRQCSDKTKSLLHNIKLHLSRTLWRYTRSYALILFITFAELFIGLSIVGVENAVGTAILIAMFDILPVVGSGTVLIPWAILSVIQGNYLRALGFGIIYLIIVIVRNIIEPKIIGSRVGLHPLVTLLGMVVGVCVFGPIGLFGLPITLALIQSLNNDGIIHLYQKSSDSKPTNPPVKKAANGTDTPSSGGPAHVE
ncbi:MAG: sporulation integral membrane protein YtvI [Clostridia bacterium]